MTADQVVRCSAGACTEVQGRQLWLSTADLDRVCLIGHNCDEYQHRRHGRLPALSVEKSASRLRNSVSSLLIRGCTSAVFALLTAARDCKALNAVRKCASFDQQGSFIQLLRPACTHAMQAMLSHCTQPHLMP